MTHAHVEGFIAGVSLMLAVIVAAWIVQRVAADRAERERRERVARFVPAGYSYTSTTKREIRREGRG